MPPRPPIPHLPPLPSSSTWSAYFPRRLLAISQYEPARVLRGRILLANRDLCDVFVREIGLRPGELVIEVNAGVGSVTRSLLEGGNSIDDGEAWKAWEEHKGVGEAKNVSSTERVKGKELASEEKDVKWPEWPKETEVKKGVTRPAMTPSSSSKGDTTEVEASNIRKEYQKPALVVASEPAVGLLERGFNYSSTPRSTPKYQHTSNNNNSTDGYENFANLDHTDSIPLGLQQSPYHPNLILSESTAYRWPTLPSLLSDPLIAPYVSIHQDGKSGKREWEDEEPKITVVITVPDSVIGEQMIAQWIGSAVGGTTGRQWIWQWGRIRLALLCGKGLYDRMMARPREAINCKLSVMTSALFHRKPLTPHHHVGNIDKAGKRLSTTSISIKAGSKKTHEPLIDPSEGDWVAPSTMTLARDYYPPSGPVISKDAIPRPTLMGVLLTPRLHSVILPEQKDAWDYVLRNCFIREVQPLEEAAMNLGFGADNLLERFADNKEGYETRWRSIPINTKTRVKDMTNDEWARVVDVFHKWAFKPDSLMLTTDMQEGHREIGGD